MKVVALGTALWALGLAVIAVLRLTGTGDVQDWWFVMCACGIALGLYGVHYCRRRHAAIERDKAAGITQRS